MSSTNPIESLIGSAPDDIYDPSMGLFGFGKGKQVFGYKRRRAAAPPEGWFEAQALVDTCEVEQTHTKFGTGAGVGWVYRTTTTYVVLDQRGAPLPIVIEAKLVYGDVPKQGARLMVAYDPSNPTDIVILLSEAEYTARITDDARLALQNGIEAPCDIVAATPTGRVSRPKAPKAARGRSAVYDVPDPAQEMLLTLSVTPSAAESFTVMRTLWDRDLGLEKGARGTLFFLPSEPARGYPVFPSEQHRAKGGDPVRLARNEFVDGFDREGESVTEGRLTISRGPMRLEG